MPLVVQKFGGSSVADPDRMRAVAEYIALTRRRDTAVVVVVSAMGKETDALIRLADEVATRQPGREWDMLVTAGERKAMALLTMALHDHDCEAESFTGSQAGIITDTAHTKARILDVRPDRIERATRKPAFSVRTPGADACCSRCTRLPARLSANAPEGSPSQRRTTP